ncbi:MAG TPA: T9SS type A sorting domain-containing protein [Ignavibacteria bacterium]|nr:T9SS type A sorting domain-containing protein [Ignavibacteria bacterium]HMQ97838.1 T9SS type A sorting domain-containing protein [Ignavibacteria bacterium]
MKSALFVFLVLFLCISSANSQSSNIQSEAYPNQSYVHDNSDFATLWRQHLEARKNGNLQLFNHLRDRLLREFPERFSGNQFTESKPSANIESSIQPPFNGDWGAGDYIVNNAPAYLPPANNTQAGLDLEVDSLGNKYVAYISANRDTLRIMKSTDQGVTWAYILSINPGGTTKWHSFDFFIADSASTFKLGFAAARTSTVSAFDGELYWMVCDANGAGLNVVQISTTPSGGGHINPSIVADSYYWSYGLTYWYVAYQHVNSGTGVGIGLRAALTNNGGNAWIQDTVRNSFNDFNIDIDYRHGASYDSIYVVFTNDLTASNPNLRLQRIALGNFGTATAWTQYNVQATSDPEVDPEIAVNRQTNEMACMWTQTTGGIKKVNYNYSAETGAYWPNLGTIANFPNDCDRGRIECSEQQGAYRISYVSKGSTADTVIYTSAFTLPPTSRTVVTTNINANTTTSPDVSGFRTGVGAYGGGVVFVGAQQNRIFYDGSNVSPVVGINNNGSGIPKNFSLSQNYPNPFNPETKINFTIPQAAFVTISIYNTLGQIVAQLVSQDMNAGYYTYDFNASDLTSGIYFYRITAGEFSETKKMMLIK